MSEKECIKRKRKIAGKYYEKSIKDDDQFNNPFNCEPVTAVSDCPGSRACRGG
jgi:hypothetical protein